MTASPIDVAPPAASPAAGRGKSRRSGPTLTVVVLTALAVGLAFQGSRGLYESTEGRYAEVAREMLDGGSWLAPTLDHRPHWTKPPPTYWAVAGGVALLGRNAWGARLFVAFAFAFGALGVAVLGAALWGRAEGGLAGLVFATSLFPVVAADTVNADSLLALWEIWAVALYWSAVRAPTPRRRAIRIAGMWAALGLAFATKGPPALLPLVAVVAYGAIARRRGWPRARIANVPGLVSFALIGLSWYAWAASTTPGLAGYFLGAEVVGRVATDRFGRNPEWWKPVTVYGLPLLFGLGAWLAWRPRRAAASLARELCVSGTSPELAFLALWLALPLVALSLSRSRLPLYVLPFFPPIVLAFARAQVRIRATSEPVAAHVPAARVAATAVALIALKALAATLPSPRDMKPLAAAVERLDPDRVVLVDERRLYGLQFYLDVPVDRPSAASADAAQGPAGGDGWEPPPAPANALVLVARRSGALSGALADARGVCQDGPTRSEGRYRLARLVAAPAGAPCLTAPPTR